MVCSNQDEVFPLPQGNVVPLPMQVSNKFKWQKQNICSSKYWFDDYQISTFLHFEKGGPLDALALPPGSPETDQVINLGNMQLDGLSQDMQSYQRDGPGYFKPFFFLLVFMQFQSCNFWRSWGFLSICQQDSYSLFSVIKYPLQLLLSQAHFYA